MKNLLAALLLILLTSVFYRAHGQTIYDSETLIRYDIATHKTDKSIPFDRPFTLMVPKVSGRGVDSVYVYEAKVKRGKRFLAPDIKEKLEDTTIIKSVKDATLRFKADSDTLQIYFPALKPNRNFDVHIEGKLPATCRESLMKVNRFLYENKTNEAFDEFDLVFFWCTVDEHKNTSYVDMEFSEYAALFEEKLKAHYDAVADVSSFRYRDDLTITEVQGIEIASGKDGFTQIYFMVEALNKKNGLADLQLGLVDIRKVYEKGNPPAITDFSARLKNLGANIVFFDSIQHEIDNAIVKGVDNVKVGTQIVNLETVREKVNEIRVNMLNNRQILSEKAKEINAVIDADSSKLKGAIYLVGNTVSSDLKTEGGNVLFLDAGFTNIWMPKAGDGWAYIPKLYWGVSIYFRPIDKNTRRTQFTPRRSLKPGEESDYRVLSRRSITQHLSLNLGLTLGSIRRQEFDNFYNNTSLLIGPAIRFKRGFKVSAGTALMMRNSPNPVVSDKKVTAGIYGSLSVDIDFIQGLKDVTSILFK